MKPKPRAMTSTARKTKPASAPAPTQEVMTLSEAAAFLRVAENDLLDLAVHGRVPCRQVGSDWRFLRDAISEWLRGSADEVIDADAARAHMLSTAGTFPDDDDLKMMLDFTEHQRRTQTVGGMRS